MVVVQSVAGALPPPRPAGVQFIRAPGISRCVGVRAARNVLLVRGRIYGGDGDLGMSWWVGLQLRGGRSFLIAARRIGDISKCRMGCNVDPYTLRGPKYYFFFVITYSGDCSTGKMLRLVE